MCHERDPDRSKIHNYHSHKKQLPVSTLSYSVIPRATFVESKTVLIIFFKSLFGFANHKLIRIMGKWTQCLYSRSRCWSVAVLFCSRPIANECFKCVAVQWQIKLTISSMPEDGGTHPLKTIYFLRFAQLELGLIRIEVCLVFYPCTLWKFCDPILRGREDAISKRGFKGLAGFCNLLHKTIICFSHMLECDVLDFNIELSSSRGTDSTVTKWPNINASRMWGVSDEKLLTWIPKSKLQRFAPFCKFKYCLTGFQCISASTIILMKENYTLGNKAVSYYNSYYTYSTKREGIRVLLHAEQREENQPIQRKHFRVSFERIRPL